MLQTKEGFTLSEALTESTDWFAFNTSHTHPSVLKAHLRMSF